MGRYLLLFSYIGQGFNGLQKQNVPHVTTVQGVLEEAMTLLKPANPVRLVTSSRTDKGVNALVNTVHVDLQHRNPEKEFNPRKITSALNRIMLKFKYDIRILKTLRVQNDFHARFNAIGRQYLYRFSALKDNADFEDDWEIPLSPFEYMRSYFVRTPVDIVRMREAATELTGTYNCTSFTVQKGLVNDWVNPVKRVHVCVNPGTPAMGATHLGHNADHMHYWDIEYTAGSFLYKQIRIMTAMLIAVGTGTLPVEHVVHLRDNPTPHHGYLIAPGYALYLKNVLYKDEDLIAPEVNEDNLEGPYFSGDLWENRTKRCQPKIAAHLQKILESG